MKIPSGDKIIGVVSDVSKKLPEVTQKLTASKPVQASCLDCLDSIGRSQIKKPASISEIIRQLASKEDLTIKSEHNGWRDDLTRSRAGKLIEGFKDLYDERVAFCQFRDKNGVVDAIYSKDISNYRMYGTIKIFDTSGKLTKEFSSDEVRSLFGYKYHPDQIHDLLRYPREIYNDNSFYDDARYAIQGLKKLFQDESKIYRTKTKDTVYRAMHIPLNEDLEAGKIFQDKSFCSTTTNLDTAKRFQSTGCPIMEIELPAGTKYLDMDRLFNIDRPHWFEQEFLLENGSKFEILEVDEANKYIKARLLP